MSILIKGMAMPKRCMVCNFGDALMGKGFCYVSHCKQIEDYFVRNDRPSWCPLVELPPHGRLIDADALAEDYDSFPTRIDPWVWNELSHAPTIIEADDSIKRAEWERHNDGIMIWWECSKCHHDAWYDGDDLYNYCPWCGAKMTIIESEGEDG